MLKNKFIFVTLFSALILFSSCENPASGNNEMPALSGTVNILGEVQTGNVLVADVNELSNRAGKETYIWRRGDTPAGDNVPVYYLTGEDVGSVITVTVSFSGNTGSITSAPTETVYPASSPVTGGEGLYIGGSQTAVNLDAYSGNILEKAFAYINEHDAYAYSILLESNITENPDSTDEHAWLSLERPAVSVKITGKDEERTITGSDNSTIFNVSSGALTIGSNICLAGKARALDAKNRGSIFMEEGAKIIVSGYAAGVRTSGLNTLFCMIGGEISGNTDSWDYKNGGAVEVTGDSLFVMTGGIITENIAYYGGGVYLDSSDCTLELSGDAKIKGNHANYGGGVFTFGGEIEINGGEISGNSASEYGGGIYMRDCWFTMPGGKINGNTAEGYGGGIYSFRSSGFMYMNGGEIAENSALYGGGIRILDSALIISNGSVISDNTAGDGGGVFQEGGSLILTGSGCTIKNNHAFISEESEGYGGGIYIEMGTFINNGVSITDNSSDQENGGGAQIMANISEDSNDHLYRDGNVGADDQCNILKEDSVWTYSPATGFWSIFQAEDD
jgi:predicted outer membrane repeat protein